MGQGVQDIVNFLLKKHTIMAGWSQDSKTHMESVSCALSYPTTWYSMNRGHFCPPQAPNRVKSSPKCGNFCQNEAYMAGWFQGGDPTSFGCWDHSYAHLRHLVHPHTRDTCGVVVWGHFPPPHAPIWGQRGPKYGYFLVKIRPLWRAGSRVGIQPGKCFMSHITPQCM